MKNWSKAQDCVWVWVQVCVDVDDWLGAGVGWWHAGLGVLIMVPVTSCRILFWVQAQWSIFVHVLSGLGVLIMVVAAWCFDYGRCCIRPNTVLVRSIAIEQLCKTIKTAMHVDGVRN